jgi:ubiquinol-cytochrome c reductase cytochrome b subunit
MHALILPACLLLFAAVHIYLIRLHNLSDPRARPAGESLPADDGKPYRFYPEHANRAAIAFAALFVVLLWLACSVPAPMEERAGSFIAGYLPRPEWYYMWLFQLLTYFSGAWEVIGSLLLPAAGIALLFAVPFLSESRIKGAADRPVATTVGSTFVVCVAYLTVMAYADVAPYNTSVTIPSRRLTAQEEKGLALYVERECAYCHNILGKGGRRAGPDLSNTARRKRTEAYLAGYIKDPVSVLSSSSMPAYRLKEDELSALAAFLLSLDFSRGAAPVSVPTGPFLSGAGNAGNTKH